MTLQYRKRNMWDDRRWNQRARLSNALLMDAVDWWCRDDREFPLDSTVASLLFIFSPRCDPFSVSENGLRERLFKSVSSPSVEYTLTWPKHDRQRQADLISSITAVLQDAAEKWNDGLMTELPVAVVNQRIVEAIVDHKYVIFHHRETTRRDGGGFHGV